MAESLASLLAADARRYRAYAEARFGYRPLTWFADPGFVCALIHRLGHAAHRRGWRKGGLVAYQLNSIITGADIEPASDFGPGLLIAHPTGVTLSTRAGRNFTVHARSGCGGSVQSDDVGAGPGLPVLGDDVTLGDFIGIQGGIHIGDGAVIESGAGALVDVPPGGRGVLASEPLLGEIEPKEAKPLLVPKCGHRRWGESWTDWIADLHRACAELERYEGRVSARQRFVIALSNPLLALLLHRISHWLHLKGLGGLARAASSLNLLVYKLSIPPRTCVGGGLLMPHLSAVLVEGVAGSNSTIYANCLLAGTADGRPIAGQGLAMGGHSGVIGPVRAGDDVRLAAKVQLTGDAPAGAQAYSPMSRVKRLEAGAYVLPVPHDRVPDLPERPWSEWRRCRKADKARLRALYSDASFAARWSVRLFRLSSAFHQSEWRHLSRWTWRANMYLTGGDFAPDALVGPGFVAPYPAGLALFATAGENLTMNAQTMLVAEVDAPGPRSRTNAPLLGSGVSLEPHSAVCGPVTVGDGVTVSPGCVVRTDVADGVAVTPRPLKIRTSAVAAAPAKR